jgi:RND family efflux transporter MFP subunit
VLGAALAVGLAVGCKPPPPSAQQAPPPPLVTVARPAVIPVQNYSDYNGHLEAVETVEIRARVKGFLEKVFFKEGDEVKAGDPLYVIDPREFQSAVSRSKSDIARAIADEASADAQVLLAQSEMDRLESLGKSATKSELARATATLAANKAGVDVARANKRSAEAALRNAELQVGYTDIKSPIAGRISRTLVTPGNLVGGTAADTLLTTIVSTDPVYVYFDAPERDRDSLDPQRGGATKADARAVLVGVANEGGYPHTGVIDFIENRIDVGTGTVRVRGRLPNPAGSDGKRALYPGLFARVRAPLGSPTDRPVIPEESLMTGQEGRFVYVIGPENKVLKRTVKVGTTVWRAPPPDDKSPRWQLVTDKPGKDGKPPPPGVVRAVVAVESGLTADDVVIVNGLQKVRPGGPATPDERQFSPPPAAK